MQEAQTELRASLTEALSLNKSLHVRMADTAFDWTSFCSDDFPPEVFSGTRWTLEQACTRGFVDDSHALGKDSGQSNIADFQTVITSTFDADTAKQYLADKLPYY